MCATEWNCGITVPSCLRQPTSLQLVLLLHCWIKSKPNVGVKSVVKYLFLINHSFSSDRNTDIGFGRLTLTNWPTIWLGCRGHFPFLVFAAIRRLAPANLTCTNQHFLQQWINWLCAMLYRVTQWLTQRMITQHCSYLQLYVEF